MSHTIWKVAEAGKWLEERNLTIDNSVMRNFGFDCHKGRVIPNGCRIYKMYITLPADYSAKEKNVKEFEGGKFAKLHIIDPFSFDFPTGWAILLEWVDANGYRNRLGCNKDDCYSLFSNDESPCLEELFTRDGIQYMDFFLPIE